MTDSKLPGAWLESRLSKEKCPAWQILGMSSVPTARPEAPLACVTVAPPAEAGLISTACSSRSTSPSMICLVGQPGCPGASPALRLGAGLFGGGPGPARLSLRTSLASFRHGAAGPSLPLPAPAAGLQQAPAGAFSPSQSGSSASRPADAFLVRPAPPVGCHPAPLRQQSRDRGALGLAGARQLRLLRQPLPLLLGLQTLLAHHPRRPGRGLVSGRSQAGRGRGGR